MQLDISFLEAALNFITGMWEEYKVELASVAFYFLLNL
jgi:hypothetical protein